MEEGGTYVERRSRSKFLRIFHFHSPTPNLNPQSGNHVSQPPFPFGCFGDIFVSWFRWFSASHFIAPLR